MVERPEFNRVVSVLTFYICSCTCLQRPKHPRPKKKKSSLTPSHAMWREEIESGPSLLHRSSERISNSRASSAPSYAYPTSSDDGVEPLGPLDKNHKQNHRITEVSIAELPRIHPPVNEHHPPVVSMLPDRGDTGWMTLPPPTASSMRSLNRQINAQRNLSWTDTARSSRSASIVSSDARPGSQDSARFATSRLPLDVENMLAELRSPRRARFQEGVLEDMEASSPPPTPHPKTWGANNRGPRQNRPAVNRAVTIPTAAAAIARFAEKENIRPTTAAAAPADPEKMAMAKHIEMAQLPQTPPAAAQTLRPLSLGIDLQRFSSDLERELTRTGTAPEL